MEEHFGALGLKPEQMLVVVDHLTANLLLEPVTVQQPLVAQLHIRRHVASAAVLDVLAGDLDLEIVVALDDAALDVRVLAAVHRVVVSALGDLQGGGRVREVVHAAVAVQPALVQQLPRAVLAVPLRRPEVGPRHRHRDLVVLLDRSGHGAAVVHVHRLQRHRDDGAVHGAGGAHFHRLHWPLLVQRARVPRPCNRERLGRQLARSVPVLGIMLPVLQLLGVRRRGPHGDRRASALQQIRGLRVLYRLARPEALRRVRVAVLLRRAAPLLGLPLHACRLLLALTALHLGTHAVLNRHFLGGPRRQQLCAPRRRQVRGAPQLARVQLTVGFLLLEHVTDRRAPALARRLHHLLDRDPPLLSDAGGRLCFVAPQPLGPAPVSERKAAAVPGAVVAASRAVVPVLHVVLDRRDELREDVVNFEVERDPGEDEENFDDPERDVAAVCAAGVVQREVPG
mmetsp:Transcript_34252/g.81686  ORF Transcript_34252/g.81686 Transcript_34252/m.81686 type:complete len:454 (-) Transcript_34252:487-1848(-)